MAAANCPDSDVPQGKVEQVCREWLVREDNVLAYKLQSEEIEHHYGHNRQRNQLVRSDLQEARIVQRSEEEDAEIIQRAYEQMLQDQEHADALIAQELQEKILKEDLERQKHIEEEDQRIALEMQKKEKLRLQRKREERELRQVEKARAEQTSAINGSDSLCQSVAGMSLENGSQIPQSEQDLSDFCIEPPSNLSEEELKKFREEQDSELARFLQEQEMKRRNMSSVDRQMAIEAQDRELARVLQEQERARARRAKERAKQKALLQQQQQQEGMNTIEEAQVHYSMSPDHGENQASQTESILTDSEWYSNGPGSSASGYSGHQVRNIAMAIDPTYNHRKCALESPTSPQKSAPSSPDVTPDHSSKGVSPYGTMNSSEGFYVDVDEDLEGAAPPYMPIQGQRRPLSLEKGKKSKKNKDGCKTQ